MILFRLNNPDKIDSYHNLSCRNSFYSGINQSTFVEINSRKMKTKIILFILSVTSMTGYSQKTFIADIKDGRNIVKFESEAPLETIIGLTNRIGVTLKINPSDITKNPKASVLVDVGSLKTGIDLRDKDMKSKSFLDVETYPTAEFTLTGFTDPSSIELKSGTKITVTVNGNLTIHGVTKQVSVPAVLTYFAESEDTKVRTKGNLLSVNTVFTIQMTDYGLTIPTLLFYKLQNEIKLTVSFIATDAEKLTAETQPATKKTSATESNK